MAKSDARVKYTLKIIKDCFINQLRATSIDKISIKQLCEQAEINRTTFYRYYNDCYDVLEDIEKELLSELVAILTEKDMKIILKKILIAIKEHYELYKIIASDNCDPFFCSRIINLCYQENDYKVKKFSSPYDKWYYNFMATGCSSILNEWIKAEMNEPIENVVDFMVQIIGRNDIDK